MISFHSVLYALVLFSELNSHSATAMPTTNIEDSEADQEGLGLILRDEPMTEPAGVLPVYRKSHMLDNSVRDEDEIPKIVIVSDMGLKGIRRLNPALARSLPRLPGRGLSHIPAEYSVEIDRRDIEMDMLRCMVGRVFRPCWKGKP